MSHRRAVQAAGWAVMVALSVPVAALALDASPQWAFWIGIIYGNVFETARKVVVLLILVVEVRLGWLRPDEAARWVAGEEG